MPKTANLDKSVCLRISGAMMAAVKERAQDARMTPLDWIRDVIRRATYTDQDMLCLLKEVLAVKREVRAIGNRTVQDFERVMIETEAKKESLAMAMIARQRR